MENSEEIKVAKIKSLNKLNWNTSMNILIDNNVVISNILSVESYTCDEKIECGNERASVSGKICIKVVYIDTDNILNTLSDSIPFNETCSDPAITNSSLVKLCESTVTPTVLSSDGVLKLSLDCTLGLNMYLNLGLGSSIGDYAGLITKKSNIDTFKIETPVDSEFSYTSTLECGEDIKKILNYFSSFTLVGVKPHNDFCSVEGKLLSVLTYEVENDDKTLIKQKTGVDQIKLDLALTGLSEDDILNLTFILNHDKCSIETEQTETGSEVSASNFIKVNGAIIRPISFEIVDDLYSCQNNVDYTSKKREYLSKCNSGFVTERISVDKTLNKDEPQIDEMVGASNISSTTTQIYLKDDSLYVEGVISGYVVYKDETNKYYTSFVEAPFVIDTKTQTNNPESAIVNLSCYGVDVKSKHADTFVVEFDVGVNVCLYEVENKDVIDNVVIGTPLSYKDIDYQIFVAKPNETNWDLLKRTKTTPEELSSLNKNLKDVCSGGEKIIVKR